MQTHDIVEGQLRSAILHASSLLFDGRGQGFSYS
jgi:hypothetical protein